MALRLPRFLTRRRRPAKEHDGFPTREQGAETIEAHVAGVCVRQADDGWYALVARRQRTRSLYPGLWECGGGQVRRGEGFTAALRRQFFEEFGLDVNAHRPIAVYDIPVPWDQQIIPGLRILCTASAGEVRLNTNEFSEYRWLKLPVEEQLDWIGGIKEMLDEVGASLGVAGIPRLQIDLDTSGLSSEVRDGVSTCIRRCNDGDYDGAITAICGVVDQLTERIHHDRSLGSQRKKSYQQRVREAFNALEPDYRASLRVLDSKEADRMWKNHFQSVNSAAYVLGTFRREFSDAHGVRSADARLVQRSIDCAVFIVRSLAGPLDWLPCPRDRLHLIPDT